MKKLTVLALAGAAFLFTACNDKKETVKDAQEVAAKTGEAYKVDSATSNVNWKAFHKGGFAPRWGTLAVSTGELSVADNQLTSGEFVIDMKSIKVDPASVTEKDKKYTDLEGHLKNEDFFDVAKFPTADFKITKVEELAAGAQNAVEGANKTVSGNLTIKDKTVNVSFPAKVEVTENGLTMVSNFTINRQDWGLAYGTEGDPKDWMISQEVDLELNVVAGK